MYFSDLNGTEPHGCELVVHVPCAEVAVAGLGVFLFARGNIGVKPHVFRAVCIFNFMCWTVQLTTLFSS